MGFNLYQAAAGISLIICGCLAGCGGSGYYEPNPPLLVRTEKLIEPAVRIEPTVVLLLVDVQVPDPTECNDALEITSAAITEGIGKNAEASPVVMLAPIYSGTRCEASGNRSFDVKRVEAVLNAAANAYPSFAVRPVLVYLNNLDLALPVALKNSLKQIRSLSIGANVLQPRLWGVTLESTKKDLPFDEYVPWTFAADPALAEALSVLATAKLPHWSVQGRGDATPLLTDEDRLSAERMKLCGVDAYVETDFPAETVSVPLTEANPTAWLALPPQLAVGRDSAVPREGRVQLELCVTNCDRFETRDDELLGRWSEHPGCAEAAAQ